MPRGHELAVDKSRRLFESRQGKTEGVRAWDRFPHEDANGWAMFQFYRDLGQTRTIPEVAKQFHLTTGAVYLRSQRYYWPERAAAFDMDQDRKLQLWMLDQRKKAAKRHVQVAQGLSNKAVLALQNVDIDKMSIDQVLKWAEVSMRMERDALGLNETRVSVSGTLKVEEMGQAAVRQRMQAVQAELAARLAAMDVVDAEVVEDDDA